MPYHVAMSNFLKKLVWLLIFWTEYHNSYQLFFFPESKFNEYLCNLRWRHNRFQTLKRCYWGILNFPILKTEEIVPLGTCYIHANFQTCNIFRTAELEIRPILKKREFEYEIHLLHSFISKKEIELIVFKDSKKETENYKIKIKNSRFLWIRQS